MSDGWHIHLAIDPTVENAFSVGFWESHWWLLLLVAWMAMWLVGVLMRPWSDYLRYRERRELMETVKSYAAQGKEPPAEVLDALSRRRSWGPVPPPTGLDPTSPAGARVNSRMERWEERQARRQERWERRRRLDPLRRWNGAIFLGALCGGFYFASTRAGPDAANTFVIVAIITGALALAATISALVGSFIRYDD